ncbi:MAG: hypothetical protein KGH65_05730 [Candidatus Micrarchaeota archaeon]|nr:hypothetical protein [Candidatus Micrarchaeota archaeon]
MEICTIQGCNNKHVGRGYCNKHYWRFRKYGDPNKTLIEVNPPQTCTIEGCMRKYTANGMCHYHYLQIYHENNRRIVISHYSGGTMKCSCCGESIYKFLTVNHDKNDGYKHKRGKRRYTGHDLIEWLIRHNFPDGFSIQCFNCNCGRAINGGICPHKS